MTQLELKNGTIFDFDNEKWCEENMSDELMGGHVQFDNRFNLFGIFFNGKCIHTSKTFTSSKNRLEKLMSKWNCDLKRQENEC